MSVVEGNKAPSFNLPDDKGDFVSLESFNGKKLVLYFYPKDDTPGCTNQACNLRDNFKQLNQLNVVVVGVSKDSVESHQRFKAKYDINFPLLSDESGQMCNAYGVIQERSMFGKKYMGIERSTFLIDESGSVVKVWRGVKVSSHVQDILAALKDLSS